MSCQACGKSVFAAEKVAGIKASFHRTCFRCAHCNIALRDKFDDHAGKFYCNKCHLSLFLSEEERREMEYSIDSSARKQSVMHAKAVIPGSGAGSPLPFKTKTLSSSPSPASSPAPPPARGMPAGILAGIRSGSSPSVTRSPPAASSPAKPPAVAARGPAASPPTVSSPAKPPAVTARSPAASPTASSPAKPPAVAARGPPPASAPSRGPFPTTAARFCAHCGKAKSGKFCSSCGQPS